MNAMPRLVPLLLATVAAQAFAADDSLSVGFGRTDYSNGYGTRDLFTVEYVNRSGANTAVVQASAAERSYDDGDDFDGVALSGTLYRDWSPGISTRTSVAVASDDPVFVRRAVDQDVTFKPMARTTLTLGARYAEYYGDNHAGIAYLAGAYYFPRLMLRYRYSHYRLSGSGSSHGNLLMLRYRDRGGEGATQLWLGQGTSIREYDWSPIVQAGDFRSVTLRRVQPLAPGLALNALVEQAWYETPVGDYEGVTVGLGLAWKW
ncbi:YaiO family outer membrane beta-barrel protein [Pseudoxanthomonas suwonensis]|uniref:YaiO beta-barrel domain-containing protein n=1 Tax=Pseudoxanthomonas suwonensis TaxID=314722 RepID=A0A0E3UNE6_9GAMM|nr:YaiO family outer membrane beta-barrel protein [Pseudoxanthomonas suwonensis]AKC87101.1 hypothetical protein WQ53_10440 [Pseudoxanthomonas suwonensis]